MSFEIRTLNEDEVISEPGFYEISLDRHHSQPCDGPSVTSGVLRKMELATPADVWAYHLLNPDRWEQEDKTALRLGRAMAAYVEGGMEEVAKHFLVLPSDKPNKPTENQVQNYANKNLSRMAELFKVEPEHAPRRPTKTQLAAIEGGKGSKAAIEAKNFWDNLTSDGKEVVTQAAWDQMVAQKKQVEFWRDVEMDYRDPLTDAEDKMIRDMGVALANDPAACAVMGGMPEVTMAWKDEQTGLWLLARPDTVSFDGGMSDYKKMNTMGRPFNARLVDNRITEHGYDMQMGFGTYVFEKLTGEYPTSVGIVAQVDKPPHHVILREISEEDLKIGEWRNRNAINRFAECLASGHWPGPGEHVGAYHRPEWQREKLLEQMNTNGVAP